MVGKMMMILINRSSINVIDTTPEGFRWKSSGNRPPVPAAHLAKLHTWKYYFIMPTVQHMWQYYTLENFVSHCPKHTRKYYLTLHTKHHICNTIYAWKYSIIIHTLHTSQLILLTARFNILNVAQHTANDSTLHNANYKQYTGQGPAQTKQVLLDPN